MADNTPNNDWRLVPLPKGSLDILQWFAAWTPDVHRAVWDRRRAWPPGFRQYSDLTARSWKDDPERQRAYREMSAPPEGYDKAIFRLVPHLLAYRLLEGSHGHRVCRLTQRGRAALLLAQRPCVEAFESHAPEVFDDYSLLPAVDRGDFDFDGRPHPRKGEPFPDDADTWRFMLQEYRELDYRQKGTLTKASGRLSQHTGTQYLNGSLRAHNTTLCLTLQNRDGREVCEASFSLEGFADLLTSGSDVPVTLDHYVGIDGMHYSEPAPPPVSLMRRFNQRMESTWDELGGRIEETISMVEDARMGKRAKAEIIKALEVAKSHMAANSGFVAQQASEEVAQVVESAFTIAADHADAAGNLLGIEPPDDEP